MKYTIHDFNEAVDNFNNSSINLVIYLPKNKSIYKKVVKYTNDIKEYTFDLQRYEALKNFGCVDENLYTEVSLFVLHINKITRPEEEPFDISFITT